MVGNKVTEAEIRRWLVEQGYEARAAKFDEVDLVAIERPGWVQVFRFQLTTGKNKGERGALFGAVRDDGRRGGRFFASRSRGERDRRLDEADYGHPGDYGKKRKKRGGFLEDLFDF